MVQNSRRSHRVAGEARWKKRSGVQAINEKSGRALALPRRLTLEADCLYEDCLTATEIFGRYA